jgi:hypothetical protein
VRKSREREGGMLPSGLRGGMRRGWSTVSSRFDLKGKGKGGFYIFGCGLLMFESFGTHWDCLLLLFSEVVWKE